MSLNYKFRDSYGNRGVKYHDNEWRESKFLGIYIDNWLTFDYHISQLCKKTGKKLHALTRVFKFTKISQQKLIANPFIMSQFSYCRLIWMFHSRAVEHRINRIYERTLGLIYPNQYQLTFKELLEKNKTVSIHQRNLQTLATKFYTFWGYKFVIWVYQ